MSSLTRTETASSTTTSSTGTSSGSKPRKKEKWRAPGRGGAGSKPNKGAPKLPEVDTMQAPRGREIALPAAGSRTMSGRGGAGNAKSHYVDNDVFRRVLEFETSVVQSKSTATKPRVGRGVLSSFARNKVEKKAQAIQQREQQRQQQDRPASPVVPVLTMSITENHGWPDESSLSLASSHSPASLSTSDPSLFYSRKRSLSMGSTAESISSAYAGIEHSVQAYQVQNQQLAPPRASSTTGSHSSGSISTNFLLGRRLRPTSSSAESTGTRSSDSSSWASTSQHHLSYLQDSSAPPTAVPPTSDSGSTHGPPTPAQSPIAPLAMAPFQRMQRGGSSPGQLRSAAASPGISQVALQTNAQTLRVPSDTFEESRDSIYSDTTSLSEFPLPPPSPGTRFENGLPPTSSRSPPPSAPPSLQAFPASANFRREFAARPPPTGALPVPPQLPAPTCPLPPVPAGASSPSPASPGASSFSPMRVTGSPRAPPPTRPRTAPAPQSDGLTLAGRMPSSQLLSPTTPVSPSPNSMRPPPLSPSSYFVHRGPSPGTSSPPDPSMSLASVPASPPGRSPGFQVPQPRTSSPMTPLSPMSASSPRSGRASLTQRDVFTPQAAPEKTAALVRALSLEQLSSATSGKLSTRLQNSTLSMDDSDDESSEDEHVPGKVPPRRAPLPPVTIAKPSEDARSSMTVSTNRSSGIVSPPLSPRTFDSRSTTSGKSGKSNKSDPPAMDAATRSRLALAALRRERERARHLVENPMLVTIHRPGYRS